jgi:hypothetical protein
MIRGDFYGWRGRGIARDAFLEEVASMVGRFESEVEEMRR